MSESIVAARYARALLDEAERCRASDRVDADVDMIRETLDESPELRRFFASPIISRDHKDKVIRTLFEDRIHASTIEFFMLLLQKKREGSVSAVFAAYRTLRDVQQGVVEAHVRSARRLSDDQEGSVARALRAVTSKDVRLKVETDPALLGGIVARIGDTVYDGSARNKLDHLRDAFEASALQPN